MFTNPEKDKIDKKNQRLNLKLALIYFLLVLLFISLIIML
jgi:hypothetical protein